MGRTQDFFHGTRANIGEGEVLLPHNALPGGEVNYPGFEDHSKNRVFMAESEDRAWKWARGGNLNRGERTSVLKVSPGDNLRVGPAETTAKTATVDERIDTMPGRQGTFPTINWNQFAKVSGRSSDHFNHPIDAHLEFGHERGDQIVRQGRGSVARKQEKAGAEQASLINQEIARGQGRLF